MPSSVEFRIYVLKTSGDFELLNSKVIKKTTAFDRTQIMNFANIETKVNVKEVAKVGNEYVVITEFNNKVDINLEETESRMDLEISSKDLSTTSSNELTMNVTLKTNEEKYELFKNPVIELELPDTIEKIEIKNINLLYKNGLSIENWEVIETEIGTKLIRVVLSGIQDEYKSDGTTEDTTVVINAEITVDRMTANGTGMIKLRYSNEVGTHISYEVLGKTAEEYEINYVSRSGLLKVQTLENYNDDNDILINYEDETLTGTINVDEEARTAKVTMEIVNNYRTYISNVAIIGKIPFVGNKKDEIDLNTTFDMTLAGPVALNGLISKVYYSTEENTSIDSSSWVENVDDFSKIKTFKVELQNENMYKGEKIELSYNLNVPANVGYNAAAYNLITTYYYFNNEQIKDSSMIGVISDTKATDLDDCQTVETQSAISVGTQVTRGGEVLEEGENVNEGQILRYNVVITNNSTEEIINLSIRANAENANMYYWYTYQIISSTDGKLTDTGEWKEDVEGDHLYDTATMESLAPGQSATFTYQVKVKHMDEINGSDVYGKIYVSADGIEEKEFNSIKNQIVDADVEVTLAKTGNEKLGSMTISTGEYYKLNVKVKNISDKDLENVQINLHIPSLLKYDEMTVYMNEYDLITEETATGTLISINHPKLEKGKEEIFYIVTVAGDLPIETEKMSVTVNSDVTVNDRKYVSNEYTRDIYQTESYITAKYYANIENGSKVKDGDIINYTLEVKNIGVVDKYVLINDRLPYGLTVNKISATLSSDGSTEELSLNNRLLTKEYYVKPQETLKINIEAVVNSNDLRTEQSAITNEFVFSPEHNIDEIDEITFYINPRDSIVSEAEDVVDNNPIEAGTAKNPINNTNTNSKPTENGSSSSTNNNSVNNSATNNSSTKEQTNKYAI